MSFRQEDKGMKSKSKEPGPGEYKSIGMNAKGLYPNSNFTNTPNINWSNYSEKRFNYAVKDKNLGPGQYDVKWLIDGKGFNYISKFRSTGSPTIIGKRPDLTTKFTCYKSKLR